MIKTLTMKKALLWILGILVALVLAVLCIWGGEIRTVSSIESVDGNPYLYQMEYKAAYDLDDIISKDVDTNAELLDYVVGRIGKGLPLKIKSAQVADEDGELATFNCTSFQAAKADGNGFRFGRNYDYFKNPTMVTVSRPKKGYASIAASDMSHFGYSLEKLPSSFMVGTTIIMRLWLDRCATVQEALDLLETVDVCHDAAVGSGYHYMVADANGDCAVVEFDKDDGWKTMIVRKAPDANYMLVTNHLLSDKYYTTEPDPAVGNPHSKSWWRYETAGAYLAGHNGTLTFDEAQECLALVHWKDLVWDNGTVEDTQFSNVYDQTALTLDLRNWNAYGDTKHFSL